MSGWRIPPASLPAWMRTVELREALREALNAQSTRSDRSWLTREEVIDAVIPVIDANTVVIVHKVECSHKGTP